MKKIFIGMLFFVSIVNAQDGQAITPHNAATLLLGIDKDSGDYAPLQTDKIGKVLFSCIDCPRASCKELACTGELTKDKPYMTFHCTCVKNPLK